MDSVKQEEELLRVSLEEVEFPKVREIVARHCMTVLGKEHLLDIVPLNDVPWLQAEHERVYEMYTLLLSGETFPMERTEDISAQIQKSLIAGAFLQSGEILDVLEVLQSSRRLIAFFVRQRDAMPGLTEMSNNLYENRLLEKHITDAIDETGNIRDNATKELQRIRADIFETSAKLRNRLQKILAKLGEDDLLQEEYVTQREGRFVLPLKVESKRAIPGLIHGVSSSGSTVFLEPMETFEMNNELSLLHSEEQREIVRILSTLTGEIGGVAYDIERSLSTLTLLDTIHAKAQYAIQNGGIKPRIVDEPLVELRNIFHPLLLQSKGAKNVIPLTVTFDIKTCGHLISGPNAGGKSVAMKSIGLNIAMALSGIFPLGECTTNPRRLLAAIGDHQSIESDLSTFSSQILRLRDILSFCAPDALVLVDEICSGTDPTEGSALASGVLDSFIERGAFFVVTTHQSSLKSYALSREKIANASLEFNPEKLVPTYKFLQGVPGNSYAFELAKSVGLPEVVMNRAKEYLGDKHSELEQSIAVMQKYRMEAEKLRMDTFKELSEAEKKRKEYEQRFNDFKVKYRKLMETANSEAAEVVRKAQSQVEQAIKEIREQSRPVGEVKQDIEKLRKEIISNVEQFAPKSSNNQSEEFVLGDSVVIRDSNQVGVIVELDGKQALIDFNGIKFKVNVQELRHSDIKNVQRTRAASGQNLNLSAATSIDVRGQRAGEAMANIDVFLNNAIAGNVPFLTIIHGKGTGALRQAIHEFLREHPQVASYRLGSIGEGDAGVTQVELR
ncbi:MAG: endonuclease MutS2 [Bacteriodetes bacterium]|nr:endonuclease MutS2 [Bacteroidota bacterium]